MSTWTAIPTSVLEVGQPIRSIDIIALRDNILAVPAGAAGAPRVVTAALAEDRVRIAGDTMTGALTVPGLTVGASAVNATGSAPFFGCRAWVNFNGTGTVAIRASGNVSSITDNGVGDYTVNFTTAMPDANYASTTGIRHLAGSAFTIAEIRPVNSSSVRLTSTNSSGGALDSEFISVAIFR